MYELFELWLGAGLVVATFCYVMRWIGRRAEECYGDYWY